MNPAILNAIPAIIAVESGGNLRAVNPSKTAFGCLQIKQCVLDDVNESNGHIKFVRADCYRKSRAVAIFCQYIRRYATAELLGHAPTAKDAALIWHYGPTGSKHGDPEGYWPRVEAFLK